MASGQRGHMERWRAPMASGQRGHMERWRAPTASGQRDRLERPQGRREMIVSAGTIGTELANRGVRFDFRVAESIPAYVLASRGRFHEALMSAGQDVAPGLLVHATRVSGRLGSPPAPSQDGAAL